MSQNKNTLFSTPRSFKFPGTANEDKIHNWQHKKLCMKLKIKNLIFYSFELEAP